MYDHARYYDPSMGRFVSMDSVLGRVSKPQTLNRYAYVEDSPERYTDPGGHGHGGQGDGGGLGAYEDWWSSPPDAWWRGLYPIASCTYSKGAATCEITVQGHLEILPSWAYQLAFIGLGILLTAATAGAALPWILGLGLAGGLAGMGVYAGYEWATGGVITTEGLLYAFGIGFAVGALVGGIANELAEAGWFAAEEASVDSELSTVPAELHPFYDFEAMEPVDEFLTTIEEPLGSLAEQQAQSLATLSWRQALRFIIRYGPIDLAGWALEEQWRSTRGPSTAVLEAQPAYLP